MMESLILFVFGGGWFLLAVLALRFGHDSRDGIDVPPQGSLWSRPNDRGGPRGGRGGRAAAPGSVQWATLIPSQRESVHEVAKREPGPLAA